MITVSRSDFEMMTIPESDADTSYLEQDGFEDRLAEYKRGEFGFIGIRAMVHVKVPSQSGDFSTMVPIESAGLWGIEDDSGADYLKSVYAEECDELAELLTQMGMTVTD